MSQGRLGKRALDESARAFVIARLEGSGPLGERLAASDLPGGSLWTIASSEVQDHQLHSFTDAGIAPRGAIADRDGYRIQAVQRPSEPLIVNLLVARLASDPEAVVVAEEGFGRPTDPWVSRLGEPDIVVAPFGLSDVFLVVTSGADRRPAMATLVHRINPFFGFVAISRPGRPVGWAALVPGDLGDLARGTDFVAMPAYDGEGYVIWEAGVR